MSAFERGEEGGDDWGRVAEVGVCDEGRKEGEEPRAFIPPTERGYLLYDWVGQKIPLPPCNPMGEYDIMFNEKGERGVSPKPKKERAKK